MSNAPAMEIILKLDPQHIKVLMLQVMLVTSLMLIAGLHLHWGLGGFWPGTDGRSMVEHVVGRTRDMQPPNIWACLAVVLGLTGLAIAVMVRGTFIVLAPLVNLTAATIVILASFIFGLRGVLGYVPPVFAYAKGTPFYKLNMLIYSPLCLLLSGGLYWINLPLSDI